LPVLVKVTLLPEIKISQTAWVGESALGHQNGNRWLWSRIGC
jgi:hypothetical protein